MRPIACIAGFVSVLLVACSGCNQNGNLNAQQAAWQRQVEQYGLQLQEAQRRSANLNLSNTDLHRQLAQSQQQLHRIVEENALLKTRLDDTASQLAQTLDQKKQVDTRVEALEASTRRRGGASITANNSLYERLPVPEIPDLNVRRDGDVIRIELPADKLFLTGGAILHQGAFPLIDQAAAELKRSYPRHIIVIEGHTDNSPNYGGPSGSNVQLSVAQAMAVYQQLTTRYLMNSAQLRVMGHGDANPIVSNATAAGKARNRRVEVVIYPDTLGG